MESNGKPDRYNYLRDLLGHCDMHLSNPNFPTEFLHIIIDQKQRCKQELDLLRRIDAEAMIMANVPASRLLHMNCT